LAAAATVISAGAEKANWQAVAQNATMINRALVRDFIEQTKLSKPPMLM
jgi:hypothetical protein